MKLTDKNVMELKKDFPILKNIVYLDSAATTQKPKQVIEKIKDYYENYNANIHRGLYKISQKATEEYENSKKIVASFINASKDEIIYTRNATESLNLLAYTIKPLLKGKNIILTELEHHSNLVPWQQFCREYGFSLKFIPINEDFTLDMDEARELINKDTAILSVTHISNAIGTINDVKELIQMAKKVNALTIIDAAQSIPHRKIDVKDLNADFLVFSGHKMLGPTGIGVLYGKKELLNQLQPFLYGGDMINEVTFQNATWNKLPEKFEAGTPNIAGAIGLAAAIDYLKNIGIENIEEREKELFEYAMKKMKKIKGIKIYSPKNSSSIISFNLEGIHSHDIATILDSKNICIRAGHHCTMPLMNKLGIAGTARLSLYFYNTKEDIDSLIQGLEEAKKIFKK